MPSKTIVAIVCVTAIVITCVICGVDGYLVGIGLMAISGLGGFALGKYRK